MSKERSKPVRRVPPHIKQELVKEAGHKCANPGCSSSRTHIHHIQHWSVYKCHNSETMIAVCPTCHDHIHHGNLPIDDETLIRWKMFVRASSAFQGHLYIEPSSEIRIQVGETFFSSTRSSFSLCKLNGFEPLKFSIIGAEILMLDFKSDNKGNVPYFRVQNNYVTSRRSDQIEFQQRPGKIQIETKLIHTVVPLWIVQRMSEIDPQCMCGPNITLVLLEVLQAGLVKVLGCWWENELALVATQQYLYFLLTPGREIIISGAANLIWQGDEDTAMFNFDTPDLNIRLVPEC